MLIAKVEEIAAEDPSYRIGGTGTDGTCDCIGLIVGAIRRAGDQWTGRKGTNYAARNEMVSLRPIAGNADLAVGEVVYKALFGGVVGSAGASDVSGINQTEEESKQSSEEAAVSDQNGSSWIIWLILSLILGLGIFAFLSTGGRRGMSKWKNSFSEMTGGLFGKKRH